MPSSHIARQTHIALLGAFLALTGGCAAVNRPQAAARLEAGERAMAAQNLSAALAEFQAAVRLDPQLADAHEQLGLAYKQAGRLEDAADSLESAARLDPQSFVTMFELGEVYRLLKRAAQAVRAYAAACALQPGNFDVRYRLASTCHEMGDLKRATEAYREALAIEPNHAHAWSNLGAAHDALGAHYEAINAYKRSLECDVNQPVVLVNLATVYLNQERFGTARATLEKAAQLAPNLAIAQERLGYCLWREQRLAEAAECYRRAMSLDRGSAQAYAGFGVVRMTQYLSNSSQVSLRDEAVESWHRSLELQPEQPKLRALIEKYRPKTDESDALLDG